MSTKHSKFYRLLSLLLVCAMLFELLPANALAANQEEAVNPADTPEAAVETIEPVEMEPIETEDQEEGPQVTVLGEVNSLREENIKHFRLDDGSFVAVDYGIPVHYAADDEEWEDIDNTLVLNEEENTESIQAIGRSIAPIQTKYTAENGDTATSFAGDLQSGFLFSTGSDESKVSFSLIDSAPLPLDTQEMVLSAEPIDSLLLEEAAYNVASAAEISYPEEQAEADTASAQVAAVIPEEEASEPSLAEQVIPAKLKADVLYRDVFDGVDLKYELYSYNIKESIIVNELRDEYAFTFYLNMEGLTPALQEEGSITLTDEAGEIAYLIPAPYMFDAAEAYSEAVSYALTETASGAWALTVTADAEWINAEDRTLPVTIDPTLIDQKKWGSSDKTFGLNYLVETSPSASYPEKATLYLGDRNTDSNKENRIFVGFDTLPTLPYGNEVINVQLMIGLDDYVSNHDTMSSFAAALHGVASTVSRPSNYTNNYNWIKGMTWNSQPAIDLIVQDYVTLSSDKEGKYVSWDMTGLAKEWYANDSAVKVACLKMMDTSHTASHRAYSYFYGYGQGYGPMVAMNYRNVEGIEGYHTYQALGAGRAGAAYISDYTGFLTTVTPLVSLASGVNPFDINMVYNSSYFLKYDADYDVANILGLTGMHFGSGMKLDLIQKVEIFNLQYEAGNTNTKKYLKYTDGDGTAHYFETDTEKDSTGKTYYDEDGLGLEAVIDNESQKNFTISNDKDQKMIFKRGFLSSIEDANGNKIKINYDSSDGLPSASAQISSVTQKNDGEAEVTIATFDYNGNNYLISMTDHAENSYSFEYSGNKLTGISREGTSSGAVEEDIVAFDYSYGNVAINNTISGLIDCISCYGVYFTYDKGDHGRITSYYEKSNNVTGAGANITRVPGEKTTYTDWGNDRIANNTDDISTTYLFDYAGRTVNAVSRDDQGTVIGASNAVYHGTGDTDRKNNKTTRTASIGKAAMPLLRNGSFESSDTTLEWTTFNEIDSSTKTANAVVKSEGARTGTDALKTYIATGKTGMVGAYGNTIYLASGKQYTVSAYINTSGAYSIPSGKGVYLKVVNPNGAVVQTGPKLTYKTDAAIDGGWVRINLPFTTTMNGVHKVYICVDSVTGIVFADDIQVEKGDTPSNRNLLDNGGMNNWKYDWKTQDDQEVSFADGISMDDGYSLKIDGSPTVAKYAHQVVALNQPGTQTYVLSGWAKADAVPDNVTEAEGDDAKARDTVKQFGLRAILTYKDSNGNILDTKEHHYVPFNPDVTDWQFASLAIVPKQADKTVASVDVLCAYEKNANTAYFDNISLVKEVAQTMRYDDEGNLESVQSTGNKEENSNYEDGNLKHIDTDGNGEYTYEYDDEHNLTSASNGIAKEAYTIDEVGNTIAAKLTSASGTGISMNSTTEYSYSKNLATKVTDSRGNFTEYTYGTATSRMLATPTKTKNAKETEVVTDYDDFGRSIQSYISYVVSVANTYDSKGYLTTVDRGGYLPSGGTKLSQKYNYTYDDFGNQTGISVGTRNLATYSYGARNGLLTRMDYANCDYIKYTYDDYGRKVNTEVFTENNSNTEPYYKNYSYKYTGDGQLYELYESTYGLKYRYSYDTIGRLIGSEEERAGVGKLQTWHKYDEHNRITAQSWKTLANTFKEEYTYDDHGRLTKKKTVLPNNMEASIEVNYNDALGRISSVQTPVSATYYNYLAGSGTNTTTPLVSAMSHNAVNGNSLEAFNYLYEYDALGNITKITERSGSAADQIRNYTYDKQSQLLSESYYSGYASYTYDTYGNIRTKEVLPQYDDEVLYTYNYSNTQWRDLLTSIKVTKNGTSNTYNYTYDNIGNPRQYYNVKNNSSWSLRWVDGRSLHKAVGNGHTVDYRYGADNIRTQKTVDGVVHEYVYAGGKLLRESYMDGIYETILEFVYDQNDRPYMLYYTSVSPDPAVGSTTSIYYYLLNYQGDVVRLVNTTGVEAARYSYDAWGNVLSATGSMAGTNPLRYRGYYYDNETGWYYLQSRYYDPGLGRFINADCTTSTGQGFIGHNMFAYCLNNPLMGVDSAGCAPEWWQWAVSGTMLVAGVILVATGVGGPAGGALICAGANSIIGSYVSEASGGSSVGGWVGGMITGAVCGTGAGLSGNLFMQATNTTGIACIGNLTGSIAVGLSSGAAGSFAGQSVTAAIDGRKLNTSEVVLSSITTGAINTLGGVASGMGSAIQGMPKISSTSTTLANSLTAAWALASEFVSDLLGIISSIWS